MTAVGLSSGSCPGLSAAELAALVRDAGGSVVDLRIGKRHRWEADGTAEAFACLRRAGVGIAFVGLGWRVGDPGEPEPPDWPPAALPAKVFCAARPDARLVATQVSEAARRGVPLLAEIHRGGPSGQELARLAGRSGIGLVVDTLGLAETGSGRSVLPELAPYVRAVQVKGFGPDRRHRRLTEADLAPVHALLELGAPIRTVTVETRAGTHLDDLALLRAVWPAERASHTRGDTG